MTEPTADLGKAKNAIAKTQEAKKLSPAISPLAGMLSMTETKSRFAEVLKDKAPAFLSSVLTAYNTNPYLRECEPQSILSSAMVAATLDLPINPNLGFAYIVPYKQVATFQIGWKGLVQLAMRSGQYKTINVCEVYDGQLISADPFVGSFVFDASAKKSDKVIGYVAYEKLLNGFEKQVYMTKENAEAHAKKFSQSYRAGRGVWIDDFDSMALKTVLKALLSKWGILSVEMRQAIEHDQAVVDTDGTPVYVDNQPAQIGMD